MARRTDRQDQYQYQRKLEKSRAQEENLRTIQHEKKMAGIFDETIHREEAVRQCII